MTYLTHDLIKSQEVRSKFGLYTGFTIINFITFLCWQVTWISCFIIFPYFMPIVNIVSINVLYNFSFSSLFFFFHSFNLLKILFSRYHWKKWSLFFFAFLCCFSHFLFVLEQSGVLHYGGKKNREKN